MTRDEVITLIQKIRELGDEEHAKDVYRLANQAYPEWNLFYAFEELKVRND